MTARLAYSDKEAAQALGLSVRSIVYLRRTGKLGYARIGRRVLIPAAELERLLRRASVKATAILDADESIRPKHSNAPSGGEPEEALERGAVGAAPMRIQNGDSECITSR
jgi:excisionase family DNA binding protein